MGEGSGLYPTLDSGTPRTPLEAYIFYTLGRFDGDPCLEDDERDEDGDYLSNQEELGGVLSGPEWWAGVYKEPAYREVYEGTDFLDRDTDGDATVDGLDDQDFDDFLNIEEINRGAPAWTEKSTAPGSRTGLWVHPFNPCLPSPQSRTCSKYTPVGNPAAWPPFSKDTDSAIKNRWSLYGAPLYGAGTLYPVTYPDPNWVDDPADPDDKPAMLSVPTEIWSPTGMPGGYDTTEMPPLHPLPRPDLGWTP